MPTPHTPGDWWLDESGERVVARLAGSERITVTVAKMHYGMRPNAEVEANARLIVASPAMHAALNEINNWLVCACIASPEDMAQNSEYMQKVAANAIASAAPTPSEDSR